MSTKNCCGACERKKYQPRYVQLVCNSRGCITDVVACWPGSVHDSTIFDHSRVRAMMETGPHDGYLTGDDSYLCRHYLLTPVIQPLNMNRNIIELIYLPKIASKEPMEY